MLSRKLPGFKIAFQRFTFGPVVCRQLVRLIVIFYNPRLVVVSRKKEVLDVVMFSTQDEQIDVSHVCRTTNEDIKSCAIVKSWITNGRGDVFNMFGIL